MNEKRRYWFLVVLYGLCGLTSVAYEVLWSRMFALQFGVSIFGVVLTVTAFMAGLGAGSLFSANRAPKVRQPLALLAALEGGIAVFALLLPLILQFASAWLEGMASHLALFQWYGLIAATALCLILFPAFAMGAGFPLILAALGNRPERLGPVYGINTLGAACGALLPLWLLSAYGWESAVRVIAGLGVLVALVLLFVSRWSVTPAPDAAGAAKRPRLAFLFAYAAIGAASLILQIAWTRLFGMVMLRTEYVLAVILATFLLGIGLGSLCAPRRHKQKWLIALPIAACGFALCSLWILPPLSAWIEQAQFTSLFNAMFTQGLLLALVTLPVTWVLGAWLPLLNSRSNGGGMWLYGVNSLGAALGALAAGFLLIPALGSAGAVVMAALIMLLVGLTWTQSRAAWLAVPLLVALAWPVMKLAPVNLLLPKAQAGGRDLFFYEDAISMTHVVEQPDGQRVLLTDLQRMDASTDPTAVLVQSNQARLPLLLHAHPHSVLFLGIGTGISVAGSLPLPDLQRTAVELSQGAIDAARNWFVPLNHDVLSQTQVVRDDVRHFLSATPMQYDVIIGDVFHPDLAGSSSLLSVQQFQRARNRLNKDGVFVQWLALNQFDNESLNVIFRSFHKVFPDAQLFLDGMHLALVGPQHKFAGASALGNNMQRLSVEKLTAEEGSMTWLGRYWGPLPLTEGALQDEWAPVIEFHLPRARYAGNLDVASSLQFLLTIRPAIKTASKLLNITDVDKDEFERAYAGTDLMVRSWLAAAQGQAQEANRLAYFAYQANPRDLWITYALADNMFASIAQASEQGLSKAEALREILRINPRHVEALRALWRLERQAQNAHAEVSHARLLELSPLDREANMPGNSHAR
ncbi:MAG: fused MFS/spermidine synthase [Pseudomonadota bacterium]